MSDPEYIVVSNVSDEAKESNLSVKPIADLESGDYILASNVSENAYVGDLTILPYDSMGDAEYAIGSTVSDNAYQGDLRVIDMPSSGLSPTWLSPACADYNIWTGTSTMIEYSGVSCYDLAVQYTGLTPLSNWLKADGGKATLTYMIGDLPVNGHIEWYIGPSTLSANLAALEHQGCMISMIDVNGNPIEFLTKNAGGSDINVYSEDLYDHLTRYGYGYQFIGKPTVLTLTWSNLPTGMSVFRSMDIEIYDPSQLLLD